MLYLDQVLAREARLMMAEHEPEPEMAVTVSQVPEDRAKLSAVKLLAAVVGVQLCALVVMSLHRGPMSSGLTAGLKTAWNTAWQIGGAATIPLFLCMVCLFVSVCALGLHQKQKLRLSELQHGWAHRGLLYAGRVAWLLGLLQTLLDLYHVRLVFSSGLPFEKMVAQLGDVAGSAYGSSLVGGGTLLVSWVAQVILTGKVHE